MDNNCLNNFSAYLVRKMLLSNKKAYYSSLDDLIELYEKTYQTMVYHHDAIYEKLKLCERRGIPYFLEHTKHLEHASREWNKLP